MKVSGSFTFWIDGEQVKNFDEFEKQIKKGEYKIEIDKLRIDARKV